MDIQYRDANINDAAEIALLVIQLGYPTDENKTRSNLQVVLEKNDGQVTVATVDNKVVAWLHVHQSTSIESGQYCEIIGLVVDGAYRNEGIGKALVDIAKVWAKNKGVNKLRVRSNVKRHKAHQFYFREGFKEVKEQKSLEVLL